MTNTFMGIYEFSDDNKTLFNTIIKPLIETHTGLNYVDAMSYYGHSVVKMDYIEKLIEQSNLIIIDLSIKNTNVFLEFGVALALRKKIVLICHKKSFNKHPWHKKISFDIQGRELILFDDTNDLKVQLAKSISDVLYNTNHISVAWDSLNPLNHIKSSSEIDITDRGQIWSNKAVNSNFIISYHVKIHDAPNENPDIRLFFAPQPSTYPCIASIFPWELFELDPNKYECHIDYFKDKEAPTSSDPEVRLQQVTVGDKDFKKIKDFKVFVSFCWPNMVFESSFFKDEKERLTVPLSKFINKGYGCHLPRFIGFEAINCRATICDIVIKEIFI